MSIPLLFSSFLFHFATSWCFPWLKQESCRVKMKPAITALNRICEGAQLWGLEEIWTKGKGEVWWKNRKINKYVEKTLSGGLLYLVSSIISIASLYGFFPHLTQKGKAEIKFSSSLDEEASRINLVISPFSLCNTYATPELMDFAGKEIWFKWYWADGWKSCGLSEVISYTS